MIVDLQDEDIIKITKASNSNSIVNKAQSIIKEGMVPSANSFVTASNTK